MAEINQDRVDSIARDGDFDAVAEANKAELVAALLVTLGEEPDYDALVASDRVPKSAIRQAVIAATNGEETVGVNDAE